MTVDETKKRFIKELLDDPEFTEALMEGEHAFNELVARIVSDQADTVAKHVMAGLSVPEHVEIVTSIVAGWYLGIDPDAVRMTPKMRHDRVYRRSLIASLAAKYASDALAFAPTPGVH